MAKIIEDCSTLQRLVDLGVDLSDWEEYDSNGQNMEIALRLNFDADVKPVIDWLIDKGVDIAEHAALFTRNPQIFNRNLDDMNNSIKYLESKNFSRQRIQEILISSHLKWLNFSPMEVDSKLGYFQKNFGLNGNEVRKLATIEPNLILWKGVPYQ